MNGPDTWVMGLVGMQSERFRKVTLTRRDIKSLSILDAPPTYQGDGRLLRLGLQAYSLGIAYEFDPYFGLSISRGDPLPHQLGAEEVKPAHLPAATRAAAAQAGDHSDGRLLLLEDLKCSAQQPDRDACRDVLSNLGGKEHSKEARRNRYAQWRATATWVCPASLLRDALVAVTNEAWHEHRALEPTYTDPTGAASNVSSRGDKEPPVVLRPWIAPGAWMVRELSSGVPCKPNVL